MGKGKLIAEQQLKASFNFNVYTKPEADAKFATKEDTYTKAEVDSLVDEKADSSSVYTKIETDALLNEKADVATTYTKTETNNLLNGKADKSTTLAGYGITDAYTKTQTDNLLNGKADTNSVYTKEETDNLLSVKANSADVYTKTEIDAKIPNTVGSATKPTYVNGGVITECAHELNKTVPANAVFTDTTYSAGNGLNLSGTSFSAKAGINVTVDGSGINVNGNGAVVSGDSGLLSGGTAYTELRPTLDGTWVKNAQTTATNLQKLEGGIEYLYGLLSYKYSQLRKYINGNYYDYETDTDSAYTKTVPAGAMPYAGIEKVGGKTVVWNQVVYDPSVANTNNWVLYIGSGDYSKSWSDNILKVERIQNNRQSESFGNRVDINVPIPITGHKYYCSATLRANANKRVGFSVGGTFSLVNITTSFARYSVIITKNGTSVRYGIYISSSNFSVGDYVEMKTFNVIDLTLLFGAGNEPTVEQFEAMFPADWYEYNAGELLSAGVTSVVSKDGNNATLQTYSIPAEVQALEGYGWSAGNVYNYIDYERKVFVQNVARVDLGTLTWGSSTSSGKKYFFSSSLSSDIKYVAGSNGVVNNIIYPYGSAGTFFNAYNGVFDCIAVGGQGVNEGRIAIYDSAKEEMTNAEFKASVSGLYAFYELATPIETDISEYLTDDNLIEVGAGGKLTFPNSNGDDYHIPVPSDVTYMIDLQEAISNG